MLAITYHSYTVHIQVPISSLLLPVWKRMWKSSWTPSRHNLVPEKINNQCNWNICNDYDNIHIYIFVQSSCTYSRHHIKFHCHCNYVKSNHSRYSQIKVLWRYHLMYHHSGRWIVNVVWSLHHFCKHQSRCYINNCTT